MEELTNIAKHNKERIGEMIGRYLREAWYFEKWYEKMGLVILSFLGMWKLGGLIF